PLFRSEAGHATTALAATQSGPAIAPARQGRSARQVDGGETAAGENRAAERAAQAGPRHMTLSRRDLEEGRMRAAYMAEVDPRHPLTDEQLAASLAATLQQKPAGTDWWVFAYGSLLWNPLFPFEDARLATLAGRHRRFCLWSLATRGTSTQPGLVLGLDRGG